MRNSLLGRLCCLLLFTAATPHDPSRGFTNAGTASPVRVCREWIEGRPWALQERAENKTRILSVDAACYDGTIERGSLADLNAWLDDTRRGARTPVLVVRSRGGDADEALIFAEKLQAKDAEVHVVQLCGSSCANWLYAGVRRRHVVGRALILYHGGFSDLTRERALAAFDAFVPEPGGPKSDDPERDRAELVKRFVSMQRRQDALYRRIGVSPQIVHGVDALDTAKLDPSRCGGDTFRPRNFVYFGTRQMRRLGVAPVSGSPEMTPANVNAALAALGVDFVACLAPDPLVLRN